MGLVNVRFNGPIPFEEDMDEVYERESSYLKRLYEQYELEDLQERYVEALVKAMAMFEELDRRGQECTY